MIYFLALVENRVGTRKIDVVNSLPIDIWSKLNALTDDKINVTEELKFVLGRMEMSSKGF